MIKDQPARRHRNLVESLNTRAEIFVKCNPVNLKGEVDISQLKSEVCFILKTDRRTDRMSKKAIEHNIPPPSSMPG